MDEREEADDDEFMTTDEEFDAFMIIQSIVCSVLEPDRVVLRDQKSCCAVLVDNNNSKTLARLHFNGDAKYISLFESKQEDFVRIGTLDDIYDHADRLRAAAEPYASNKAKRPKRSLG